MVKLDISNLHKAVIPRTKSKETLKIAQSKLCVLSKTRLMPKQSEIDV